MTDSSQADSQTIAVYDQQAARYRDVVRNTPDKNLKIFLQTVPAGAKILDFGCGVGNASAAMVQAGLEVDAADASEGMLELAAEHPGLNLLKMEFAALDAVEDYDAIWANFSLLHARRSELSDILKAIVTALKPNGLFFMSLKEGSGEARDSIGRRYTYYSLDECVTYLETAGLTIEQTTSGSGKGLDGSVSNWLGFFARKKK